MAAIAEPIIPTMDAPLACLFENPNRLVSLRECTGRPETYSLFAQLRSIYGGDPKIVALSMHIDESGIHADSPVVAVAGYIARPESWSSFDVEWKQIIHDLNTHLDSPATHFHMAQFVGNFDEYRSLADKPYVKSIFLARVLHCIRDHAMGSFAVTFQQHDFVDLVGPDWKVAVGSPYTFGLRMCMFLVAEWVRKQHPDERIVYVMEKGNEFEFEADRFIRLTVAHEETRESLRYLDHIFVAKDNSPGCQAADVIVYETFRMMRTLLVTKTDPKWPHITPGSFGPRHLVYSMKRAAIEDILVKGLKDSGFGFPDNVATLEDVRRFLLDAENKGVE